MKFEAIQNGRKVHTFVAASVETIYRQYNRFCKNRGFDQRVETSDSFGFLAWSNGSESIILVKAE